MRSQTGSRRRYGSTPTFNFNPEDIERLRSHNLPLTCALYAKKGKPELACQLLPESRRLVLGDGGGLTEMLYVGAGCLHVRREVYDTIRAKYQMPECNLKWGRPLIPYFSP